MKLRRPAYVLGSVNFTEISSKTKRAPYFQWRRCVRSVRSLILFETQFFEQFSFVPSQYLYYICAHIKHGLTRIGRLHPSFGACPSLNHCRFAQVQIMRHLQSRILAYPLHTCSFHPPPSNWTVTNHSLDPRVPDMELPSPIIGYLQRVVLDPCPIKHDGQRYDASIMRYAY